MKPGPADRPLIYLLLGLTVALALILPALALQLWRLLDAPAYRGGPGRLKPLVPLLLVLGELLLWRRFRRQWDRLPGR